MIRPVLIVFALSALVAACSNPARAALVVDPAPEGAPRAADFAVKVNGQELFVYQTEPVAIASFSSDVPVEVEVRPTHDVKRLDIRPRSLGVAATLRDNVIRFRLTRPCQLSVELNGESQRALYVFANPLETERPEAGQAGVRTFEAGRIHDVGRIDLRTGETLYIPGGTIVRGRVAATDANRVRILGRGILESPAPDGRHERLLTFRRCRDLTIEGITIVDSHTWTVVPQHCDGVTIRNLKIVNWKTGSDGIDLVATSDVTIESSFVRANDDCIAIKTFGDESYPGQGPSPGRDVRSIRVTGSVFWNMAWGNALEIGFELRAPSVSGILFQDCDVIHVERGATFSIHNGDAATVSDVRFEDIRVEDSRHKLIDLAVFLSQYSTDRPADREEIRRRYMDGAWDGVLRVTPEQKPVYAASRGHIKGVLFKDIAVVDGGLPFSILSGFDAEHAVEDVVLDNLTFHGQPLRDAEQARFFVENARGIRFVAGGPQRAGGSQGSADAPRPPQR